MGSRKNPQPFLKLPEPFFTVLADAEHNGQSGKEVQLQEWIQGVACSQVSRRIMTLANPTGHRALLVHAESKPVKTP